MSALNSKTGQGMPKPTSYYDCTPPDAIYHMGCGGQMVRHDRGGYYETLYIWECSKCDRKYNNEQMKRFKPSDLADRFFKQLPIDPNVYVVVEDTDGHKGRFTRTVTAKEAREKGLQRIDPFTCKPLK